MGQQQGMIGLFLAKKNMKNSSPFLLGELFPRSQDGLLLARVPCHVDKLIQLDLPSHLAHGAWQAPARNAAVLGIVRLILVSLAHLLSLPIVVTPAEQGSQGGDDERKLRESARAGVGESER